MSARTKTAGGSRGLGGSRFSLVGRGLIWPRLQVAASLLFEFERLEERFEVALAEAL